MGNRQATAMSQGPAIRRQESRLESGAGGQGRGAYQGPAGQDQRSQEPGTRKLGLNRETKNRELEAQG